MSPLMEIACTARDLAEQRGRNAPANDVAPLVLIDGNRRVAGSRQQPRRPIRRPMTGGLAL